MSLVSKTLTERVLLSKGGAPSSSGLGANFESPIGVLAGSRVDQACLTDWAAIIHLRINKKTGSNQSCRVLVKVDITREPPTVIPTTLLGDIEIDLPIHFESKFTFCLTCQCMGHYHPQCDIMVGQQLGQGMISRPVLAENPIQNLVISEGTDLDTSNDQTYDVDTSVAKFILLSDRQPVIERGGVDTHLGVEVVVTTPNPRGIDNVVQSSNSLVIDQPDSSSSVPVLEDDGGTRKWNAQF